MILVSVFDKLANVYGKPELMQNEETAKRWFNYVVEKSDMVASDLELYLVGSFSQDKGITEIPERPVFLCRARIGDIGNEKNEK